MEAFCAKWYRYIIVMFLFLSYFQLMSQSSGQFLWQLWNENHSADFSKEKGNWTVNSEIPVLYILLLYKTLLLKYGIVMDFP